MINIEAIIGNNAANGSNLARRNLARQQRDDIAILALPGDPFLVFRFADRNKPHRHIQTVTGKQHILEDRRRFGLLRDFHHHPQGQGVVNHSLANVQHIDVITGKKISDGRGDPRLVRA